MTPTELLKLMETQSDHQQPLITIDQHRDNISRKAELETELVTINRKIDICKKNIQHYESHAMNMLKTNPQAFGSEIIKLLHDICTAKVMKDKPDLYNELIKFETRSAEIKKEII